MSLNVVELFSALQGEGDKSGCPSIFVRLGGCNFTCSGFGCTIESPIDGSVITGCDSIHAVNVKHFKNTWNTFTGTELSNNIMSLIKDNFISNPSSELVDIVITGGEPMIHHANEDLLFLLKFFISRGHKVYVETNGTQEIDFNKYPIWKKVSFTLSVKMKNSGEPKEKRWKPDVVESYISNTNGSTFKFVLDKDLQGEDEVHEFLQLIPSWAPVYVMPQGGTRKDLEESAKIVYEYSLKHGFRYSDRLHIRMYDDEQLK